MRIPWLAMARKAPSACTKKVTSISGHSSPTATYSAPNASEETSAMVKICRTRESFRPPALMLTRGCMALDTPVIDEFTTMVRFAITPYTATAVSPESFMSTVLNVSVTIEPVISMTKLGRPTRAARNVVRAQPAGRLKRSFEFLRSTLTTSTLVLTVRASDVAREAPAIPHSKTKTNRMSRIMFSEEPQNVAAMASRGASSFRTKMLRNISAVKNGAKRNT